MDTLSKDIREKASILIERWANKKLYVVKNRHSSQPVPYQIHPNEAMKLMEKYSKVVITNESRMSSRDQYHTIELLKRII